MSLTPDHLYTTFEAERKKAITQFRYIDEGTACHVYSPSQAPPPYTVPLYRLYRGGSAHDHFYTTIETEKAGAMATYGYGDEGIACYVFPLDKPQPQGTLALFRLYSHAQVDHFYTTSVSERDQALSKLGYVDEGIACYVLPDDQPYFLEDKWNFCGKCHGLHYTGYGYKTCPKGGTHNKGSRQYRMILDSQPVTALFRLYNDKEVPAQGDYTFCIQRFPDDEGFEDYCSAESMGEAHMVMQYRHPGAWKINFGSCFGQTKEPLNEPQTLQDQWKWCSKCQGMFYSGINAGVCPVDHGPHDGTTSGNYRIADISSTIKGVDVWARCIKCQGMFNFFKDQLGVCPAGDTHVRDTNDLQYKLSE